MKKISLLLLIGILMPITAKAWNSYCIEVYNANPSNRYTFTYSGKISQDDWSLQLTIPSANGDGPKYWVGAENAWREGNLGNKGASSANAYISDIPLRSHHDHKIGNAAGATGVLHIYDNSTSPNLYPEFVPDGYGVKWGIEGQAWNSTPLLLDPNSSTTYWSELIQVPDAQVTNGKYYVGLKTATDYAFGGCSETKTIASMGVRTSDSGDSWLLGNMTANTHRYGKFRIWIDNGNKNFLCHFVPFYHVTFNVNGGEGSLQDAAFNSLESGHSINLSSYQPTKANATLIGWKDNRTSNIYTTTQTISNISDDMELVAQWCTQEIIEDNMNVNEIEGDHNLLDLVIADGVTLTATDESTGDDTYFHSVTIGAGAILNVPKGAYFNTYSLILEGGAEDGDNYQFTFPEVKAVGHIKIHGDAPIIYYDYLLNMKQWYALCLPVDVPTSELSFVDGREATYDVNYLLQEYNSDMRAAGGSGWNMFTEAPTTLTAGKGYNICALPEDEQTFARLRIPLHYNLSNGEAYTGSETTERTISVVSQNTGEESNRGWNLIGNPFLANYKGFVAMNRNWQNTLEYATFPNWDGTKYSHTEVDFDTLPAFHTFFVQVEPSCTSLTFAYDYCMSDEDEDPGFFAPLRAQETADPLYRIGLLLSNDKQNDKVGLRFADRYTKNYDFNGDLSKWKNKELNLYALLNDQKLAFMANPKDYMTALPLGYIATKADEYTFALDTRYDYTDIQSVLLTDAQTGTTVDLKSQSYTFTSPVGTFNQRFTVSVVTKKVATSTETIDHSTSDTQKLWINGTLYLLNNQSLYTIQGTRVSSLPNE